MVTESHATRLARIAKDRIAGTVEMMLLVMSASRSKAWRPERAGLMVGVLSRTKREWMTAGQLRIWYAAAKKQAKDLGEPPPHEMLGVTANRLNKMRNGFAPISKEIALACAHYAMQLPAPAAMNPEMFRLWFQARFGDGNGAADALGRTPGWLLARLKGFDVIGGKRVEYTVEPYTLRALDWLYRIGPVCPYGQVLVAPAFPGQVNETRKDTAAGLLEFGMAAGDVKSILGET